MPPHSFSSLLLLLLFATHLSSTRGSLFSLRSIRSPPPPPHPTSQWLPTGTPFRRKKRIDNKQKSFLWSKHGSTDIPNIDVGVSFSRKPVDDEEITKNEGTSTKPLVRAFTRAFRQHPVLLPETRGREGDGSLVKLYESIQTMESLERRASNVANHMNEKYPSTFAGDNDVEKEEEEVEEVVGLREKVGQMGGQEVEKENVDDSRMVHLLRPDLELRDGQSVHASRKEIRENQEFQKIWKRIQKSEKEKVKSENEK